jgi:hypothetical protein
LAAEKGFDQRILALIDTCVRVTARGFDGDANARNEERWQKVVNLYKSLLIICLQFLNNFIMQNEQRKLVLWLDVFGYHSNGDYKLITPMEPLDPASPSPQGVAPIVRTGERSIDPPRSEQAAEDLLIETISSFPREPANIKEEAAMLLLAQIKDHMEKLLGRDLREIQEMGKDPEQVKEIRTALTAILGHKADEMRGLKDRTQDPPEPEEDIKKQPILCIDRSATAGYPRICWADLPDFERYSAFAADSPITEEDTTMSRTYQSGVDALQLAKQELMARAQEASQVLGEGDDPYDHDDGVGDDDGQSLDDGVEGSLDEEDEDEEDEDDDDDYRGRPGDQQRGLLTDIPLVLGPAEIEALPMIVKAGIVDNLGVKNGDREVIQNMQAIRCHILLTQETGRNLLRELLIFIAAWDLPDEEQYFKYMEQIMEAILKNGLMSHAYADFGQQKDIISPAQAVVVKILTQIFRKKYTPGSLKQPKDTSPAEPPIPASLTRVDVLTTRYIFTIFRGTIIPESCGLIYLQGQIRANRALPEDFPLNLWDMERVYEGVYQLVEFFAVLTENNDWKNLLIKWELAYDLVTLLKELDANIPKGSLSSMMTNPPPVSAFQGTNSPTKESAQPVAVERPYDPTDVDPVDENGDDVGSRADSAPITEDPCEFEWRNLKKLVLLVLSSLVWRSPEVQTQIREHGGVECILSCTSFDAHNPYMKEHAVMCLKFLLENNKENQKIVEELEAREVVRDENGVLEKSGYEAVIDQVGKLAIQKKNGPTSATSRIEELLEEE